MLNTTSRRLIVAALIMGLALTGVAATFAPQVTVGTSPASAVDLGTVASVNVGMQEFVMKTDMGPMTVHWTSTTECTVFDLDRSSSALGCWALEPGMMAAVGLRTIGQDGPTIIVSVWASESGNTSSSGSVVTVPDPTLHKTTPSTTTSAVQVPDPILPKGVTQ